MFGIKFRNPIVYEKLTNGTHWTSVGVDSDWDMGNKLECLLNNSIVFSCYDLISDLMAQAKVLVDGEENENHPIVKLLNNPNPLQSKKDFIKEYYAFKVAYGWVFQYPVKPIGMDAKYIYNLNTSHIQFDKTFPTRLVFDSDSINEVEEKQFRYEEENIKTAFSVGDVVKFFDVANGLSKNMLLKSPSRLDAISKHIRNIDVALDAEQSAISKAGRFIVGASQKGQVITKPIDPKEKQEIERNFGKYGHGHEKGNITITNSHLDVNSLHTPMSQLGIHDSIKGNAIHIMNAFRIPLELNPLTDSGSTFENQKQSVVNLIQNVVKVEVNDLLNTYKNYFDTKEELSVSFAHLDSMQLVEKMKAEQALQISVAVRNLSQANVSNISDVLEDLGLNIELDEKSVSRANENS